MSISRKWAKKLAVAYQAYCEASDAYENQNSIAVWATILLEAQERTGIELCDPDALRMRIANIRHMESA